MSLVKIEYFRDGKRATEVCTLISKADSVQISGHMLLEDDFGLWYLDERDLISMRPATEAEQSGYAWHT